MGTIFQKCCIFTSCCGKEEPLLENDHGRKEEPLLENYYGRKEEPLLENYYGSKITEGNQYFYAKDKEMLTLKTNANSLQNIVDQGEIAQNVPEKIIREKITKCTRVSLCKHMDCDFNPMLSTIKSVRGELKESKDSYDVLLRDYNSNISKKTERIKHLTHALNGYKKDLENKENTIFELNNSVQVKEDVIHKLQTSNTWYEQNKKILEAEIEYYKNDVTFLANSHQFYKNETEKLKRRLASTRLDTILEEECPI